MKVYILYILTHKQILSQKTFFFFFGKKVFSYGKNSANMLCK